ncbi:unnamed protein product [Pedinophyceae sp. YPF-701]|nr:unnamed protein product [Pedinophyceae sp. YPF-701]
MGCGASRHRLPAVVPAAAGPGLQHAPSKGRSTATAGRDDLENPYAPIPVHSRLRDSSMTTEDFIRKLHESVAMERALEGRLESVKEAGPSATPSVRETEADRNLFLRPHAGASARPGSSGRPGSSAHGASGAGAASPGGHGGATPHDGSIIMDKADLSWGRDSAGHLMFNEFIVLGNLGAGSFGKIRLCMDLKAYQLVAIKMVNKAHRQKVRGMLGKGGDARAALQREMAVIKALTHPSIVNVLQFIDDPSKDHMLMVLEHVEGGVVQHLGADGRAVRLVEQTAQEYFRQLVGAVEYLHVNGVVHGDIKPDNLLLSAQGRVKLIDFGSSVVLPSSGDDTMQRTYGTPAFCAPEIARGEAFSGRAADLWALGVTLYHFVFADLPFKGPTTYATYAAIDVDDLVLPADVEVSHLLRDLLERMLEKDPAKRITLTGMKQHPWVREGGPAHHDAAGGASYAPVKVSEDELAAAVTSYVQWDIKEHIAGFQERVFERGEYLFREGEVGDSMFYIVEGDVDIVRCSRVPLRASTGLPHLRSLQAVSQVEAAPRRAAYARNVVSERLEDAEPVAPNCPVAPPPAPPSHRPSRLSLPSLSLPPDRQAPEPDSDEVSLTPHHKMFIGGDHGDASRESASPAQQASARAEGSDVAEGPGRGAESDHSQADRASVVSSLIGSVQGDMDDVYKHDRKDAGARTRGSHRRTSSAGTPCVGTSAVEAPEGGVPAGPAAGPGRAVRDNGRSGGPCASDCVAGAQDGGSEAPGEQPTTTTPLQHPRPVLVNEDPMSGSGQGNSNNLDLDARGRSCSPKASPRRMRHSASVGASLFRRVGSLFPRIGPSRSLRSPPAQTPTGKRSILSAFSTRKISVVPSDPNEATERMSPQGSGDDDAAQSISRGPRGSETDLEVSRGLKFNRADVKDLAAGDDSGDPGIVFRRRDLDTFLQLKLNNLMDRGVDQLTRSSSNPFERRLACHAAGSFVGEMAVLTTSNVRTASGRARTAVRAIEIPGVKMHMLFQRYPEMQGQLQRLLAKRNASRSIADALETLGRIHQDIQRTKRRRRATVGAQITQQYHEQVLRELESQTSTQMPRLQRKASKDIVITRELASAVGSPRPSRATSARGLEPLYERASLASRGTLSPNVSKLPLMRQSSERVARRSLPAGSDPLGATFPAARLPTVGSGESVNHDEVERVPSADDRSKAASRGASFLRSSRGAAELPSIAEAVPAAGVHGLRASRSRRMSRLSSTSGALLSPRESMDHQRSHSHLCPVNPVTRAVVLDGHGSGSFGDLQGLPPVMLRPSPMARKTPSSLRISLDQGPVSADGAGPRRHILLSSESGTRRTAEVPAVTEVVDCPVPNQVPA